MWILRLGAIVGLLGVIAGAFGGHALREQLSPEQLATFEIGVRYQVYHALALVACGLLALRAPSRLLSASAGCFLAGVILFSGSLQFLAVSGVKALGMITPVGGLLLMAGWLLLALSGAPRSAASGSG